MSTTQLRRFDAQIARGMEMREYYTVIMLLDEFAKQMGSIPERHQLTYLRCLFHTRAYVNCIKWAKRFREAGNTSRDITFAEGLCFYHLGRFGEAVERFEQHAQWGQWLRKAAAMHSASCTTILVGGEGQGTCFDVIRTIQTEDKVKMLLAVGDFARREIEVVFGYDWVDLAAVRSGVTEASRNFELFAPIIAAESFFHFTKEGLHLTLKKEKQEKWPDTVVLDASDCADQEEVMTPPKKVPMEELERQMIQTHLVMLGRPEEKLVKLAKSPS